MKKIFYLILGLTLFGTACKKDINKFIPDPFTSPMYVMTNIGGQIIDENNIAVEGASITIVTTTGDVNLTTDKNGIFSVRDVEVRQDLAYVKAEYNGYFLGSKSLYVTENEFNYLTIKLLEKTNIGMVSSDIGGTIETTEGAKITLPENGFIDNNGNSYSGNVQIAAKWLNPTANNLLEIMPGALVGINNMDVRVALVTAGMMAIELTGDSGQEINIGNGAKAILEFPLPSTGTPFTFPETIPLWSFDEDNGIWIEEGIANLVGDRYIGEVTHFSFWNCDDPYNLIQANGKITDTNGNPVPNVPVQIRVNGTNLTGSGWTDANGCYGGLIPQNQDLTIEILDDCWNVVTSLAVGSFSENTTLPTIEVELDGLTTAVHLTGTLLDCDENPVQNGYVIIGNGNSIETVILVDLNGNFDATVLGCFSDTVLIKGIDVINEKQSNEVVLNIAPTINVGNLVACNIINEYVKFSINGIQYSVTEGLTGVITGDFVQIYSNAVNGFSASLIWIGVETGIAYPVSDLMLTIPNQSFSNSSLMVTLTEFGMIGEFIIGEFSGIIEDETGEQFTITDGQFQLERDF